MNYYKYLIFPLFCGFIVSCSFHSHEKSSRVFNLENEAYQYKIIDINLKDYLIDYEKQIDYLPNIERELILCRVYSIYLKLKKDVIKLINQRFYNIKDISEINNFTLLLHIITKFKRYCYACIIKYLESYLLLPNNKKSFKKYNPLVCYRMLIKWFKLKLKEFKGNKDFFELAKFLFNGDIILYENTFNNLVSAKISSQNYFLDIEGEELCLQNLYNKETKPDFFFDISMFFKEEIDLYEMKKSLKLQFFKLHDNKVYFYNH